MTLLTGSVISTDVAILATDSAAFGADSGRALGYSMSKAATLPHLRAAVSAQGSAGLLAFLVSKSHLMQSVDDAAETMPRLLDSASRVVPGLEPTAANTGCRVALAGYSQARRAMVIQLWTSQDELRTVRSQVLTAGMMLVPKDAAPRKPVKNVADFERYVMQVQLPFMRERHGRIGGDLVLFQIDRHGVRITYGPDLGPPDGASRFATAAAPSGLEHAAAIYDPATSFDVLTVSPNTSLPDPSVVEQVTGVTVASGTTDLTDRSVIVRTLVSWDAVVNQAVRQSGKIEVQWIEAAATLPSGDWPGRDEAEGNATELPISGLRAGVHYLFRVRARTTLGVRGLWSNQVVAAMADVPAQTVSSISVASAGTTPFTATGSFSFTHSSVGFWTFAGNADSKLTLDVTQLLKLRFSSGAVGSLTNVSIDVDLKWDGNAVSGRTISMQAPVYTESGDKWASFTVPIRYVGTASDIADIGGVSALSTHGYTLGVAVTMRDSTGAAIGSSISGTWESSTRNSAVELLK